MVRALVAAFGVLCCITPAYSATLMVDDDGAGSVSSCDAADLAFTSVAQAAAVAFDGDTVLVCPGTYSTNIRFQTAGISLRSVAGPQLTILDGGGIGTVVAYSDLTVSQPLLEGFTIRNGSARAPAVGFAPGGSGVAIWSTPAIVRGNVFTGNDTCYGAAVFVYVSAAIVEGNTIENNQPSGCSLGAGGVMVKTGAATVRRNIIRNNGLARAGGGIWVIGPSPTIENNIITGNRAQIGGGVALEYSATATIRGNLIIGNQALLSGGGVFWRFGLAGAGARIINNTIAANDSPGGSGMFADGVDRDVTIVNNNVVAMAGQMAVLCGDYVDTAPPSFAANNIFSAGAPAYGGVCADQTGLNGNVSVDPMFVDAAADDYHLRGTSPLVDAGRSDASLLPELDVDGDPRILDGNDDGRGVVDIGADEYPGIPRRVQIDLPRLATPVLPLIVAGWAVDGRGSGTGVDAVHVWAHPSKGGAAVFLGVARYGLARDDVGTALRDVRFTNAGFRLEVTTPLAEGDYLLVAYARSIETGRFELTASKQITIGSGLRMTIDSPAAGASVRGAILQLSGWAVDTRSATGTGIEAIHVYAYPESGGAAIFLGAAILGVLRADVAEAFDSSEFARSGWLLAANLPRGTYTIAVHVRSSVSGAFVLGSTRRVTMVGSVPRGTIDSPVFGLAVLMPSSVSGWAIDLGAPAGTGIDAVHVYVFPSPGSGVAPLYLGAAAYGLDRGDVAAEMGPQFRYSGYQLPFTGLIPGYYLLVAYARSTITGAFDAIDSRPIRVSTTRLMVESPRQGAALPLVVSGWALDQQSTAGSGVDAVHVYARNIAARQTTPALVGVATLGVSRPDVAAAFGPQFANAGYQLSAPQLGLGIWEIFVYARTASTGTFDTYSMVRVDTFQSAGVAGDQ